MKVCFIGHRKIDNVDGLTAKLYDTVYELIANGADTFLFGSKSEFNSACWNTVSALKQQYSFIERVYVRAEYPVIDQSYTSYLLQYYEKTFYPPELIRAGKSVYVKRNRAMIDASDICILNGFNLYRKFNFDNKFVRILISYFALRFCIF